MYCILVHHHELLSYPFSKLSSVVFNDHVVSSFTGSVCRWVTSCCTTGQKFAANHRLSEFSPISTSFSGYSYINLVEHLKASSNHIGACFIASTSCLSTYSFSI
jgi:hypothetical protein